MKMSKSIVDSRRNRIMQKIQTDGSVTVEDLAESLQVSQLTIRRDLQYWEEKGAIERFYGGAKLIQHFVSIDDHLASNEPYKHAIAKYAANFVEEGDTIFINTSSTALLLLKYIKDKHVTVITNNGKVIMSNFDPKVSIFLTGGELRTPKEALVGDFALNNLQKISATKCFLGCSGLTSKNGMTTAIQQEVTINEIMIKNCIGQTFLLADHTKIGNIYSFVSGAITDFDYLITDTSANETELYSIREMGVETITLEPLFNI
ncbi:MULTISPECIES: DeoR/GlpR family DNA-binding transcription regulator [Breznakia]|uniref:DeoR family transcriptional regulator n=1 Tax=Breznakia blatticola TaxID=1754012 RepID=A0A4R7ZSX0_9FIRM|nr:MULTISPECIES: DeoR/GlpR family DNA-binding transcription regulator [Breznakia]MDH6368145.1 DeoR/GlpR family transcriptional regulator of sugar metabolism [Breznakia sp. PH1-1]MDH6405228.1 DeoR/GlpR family transcriptional regulator of sugar metabolism [Breznakia sp. PF1-11]MDH6412942.1 DeoR/GlpR family transcriptional regulator of sugar metabolism [Breznakia sp. PFB1-11]MDH6415304.1 DeoR/GlpR family transcriptional regulator of sugar metabolism [Breznakia sp. PFB1-14]MDH6417613.1 DeoR/GlpR f